MQSFDADKSGRSDHEEVAKALTALKRAVPITRMIDYGMNGEDAVALAALDVGEASWDAAATQIADRRFATARRLAEAAESRQAGQHASWGAAALAIGQLVFNADTPERQALLARSNEAHALAGELAGAARDRFAIDEPAGRRLYGWWLPVVGSRACVIVVGGLSGWGASYLGMAQAMNARGLSVILAEGPGQGQTRMDGGTYLSRGAIASLGRFIDHAQQQGCGSVGIMGNSFGGIIAAHVAASDERIAACCINGAVPRFVVPDFRTPREQMEAAFGVSGAELGHALSALDFDPQATPIRAPLLIVEGGADPLVPLDAQLGFASGSGAPPTVLRWDDGEHTIYNHAADRNALVSAWFADQLKGQDA